MNDVSRFWTGIVFKCLAVLALIFAFVFFMRMNEEQSLVDRYRAEGTVSRAEVTEKDVDQMVYTSRRGRSRTEDVQILLVRFAVDSTVPYADYPARVSEADLPTAPPLTGDPLVDGTNLGAIFVPKDVYDATSVGDTVVVVDTPYSGDDPEFYEDIRSFDPTVFYPRMAIALVLMVVFGLIGWRLGRRRKGGQAATAPGPVQSQA